MCGKRIRRIISSGFLKGCTYSVSDVGSKCVAWPRLPEMDWDIQVLASLMMVTLSLLSGWVGFNLDAYAHTAKSGRENVRDLGATNYDVSHDPRFSLCAACHVVTFAGTQPTTLVRELQPPSQPITTNHGVLAASSSPWGTPKCRAITANCQ